MVVRNWESSFLEFSPYYKENWQYYYDYIIKHIKHSSKVLDIGSGQGFLSEYLQKEHKCNVVAIDVSPIAVDLCKNKGINSVCLDPEIDDIDGTFDYIVLAASMEHMIFPRAMLERIKKNLNKDGEIMIIVPNTTDLLSRLRFLLGRNVQQPIGELFDNKYWLQAAGHLHFYNKFTLNILLDKVGYRPIQWQFVTEPVNYKLHSVFGIPFSWFYHLLYDNLKNQLFSQLIIVRAKVKWNLNYLIY